MARRFMLPEPPAARGAGLLERLRTFLLHRWTGRLLLLALVLVLLADVGVPLPAPLVVLASAWLIGFAAWGLFRLGRQLLGSLLWKIRTKLILSYSFVAVVPLVLLSLLFFLAGLLFTGLMGSYVMSTEVERLAGELMATAHAGMAAAPGGGPALERELEAARALHPDASFALVREGRVVASRGEAPRALP